VTLWDRFLESIWTIEDPADGGPLRHAWLHFTSSWFYPAFAAASAAVLTLALLSIGSIYAWLALHALALIAIVRFLYDRSPRRRAARRRARRERRRHEVAATRVSCDSTRSRRPDEHEHLLTGRH
jgi:hypothetical protein